MAKARGYRALRAGATSGSWEPEVEMTRTAKNLSAALADAKKSERERLIAEGKRKQKAADEAAARSEKERKAKEKKKVKYRKRQKTNAVIEAKRLRDKTIASIQEINPFFSDPDKVLTQQQLSEKLGQYMDRKSDLEYIKEMNPELWEERLRSGRMPNKTTLAKEALYYLNQGAGDPNATVDQRKGIKGVLDTELPEKLNQAERDSILGESGSKTRKRIETDRTGTPQQFHAKQWNELVRHAADKLEADGKIKPGLSDVKRPWGIEGEGAFLSNKELWRAERSLDYGHLGSASNPGFHYVINYDSNGQPEFSLWNKQTSASMTPTEYLVADQRIQSGSGYRWDEVNRGRFNSYLDEMLGILDDSEFERLSQTLEYFDHLPNSPYHLEDAQRNYVERTDASGRPNADINSAYHLTNDVNNFSLDNFTASEKVNVRRSAIASRLAFMRGLPSIDLDAAIHQGLLPNTAQKNLSVSVDKEAKNVAQIPQEDIDLLKQNVMLVMKEGEPLTVDQVMRRAIAKMPKAPVALIAMASSMGKAFADSPADATTLEKAMSGLQAYDEAIVQPGQEWVDNITDAIGVKGILSGIDDRVGGDLEQSQGASGHVARFLYGAAKDIPAETAGIVRYMYDQALGNTGSTAQGSVPEGTPYYDFGEHALPHNVVKVMPVANPALKYGGLVQSQWPTSESN